MVVAKFQTHVDPPPAEKKVRFRARPRYDLDVKKVAKRHIENSEEVLKYLAEN